MTPDEITLLLAKAAAYDQRTVGRADILAWHEAIGDLEHAAPAYKAVAIYYGNVTDGRRIMPGHIRAIYRTLENDTRIAANRERCDAIAAQQPPPAPHDPQRHQAVMAYVDTIRDVLPAGRPEKLSYGREYWGHRNHNAAANEPPNPNYDPTMPPIAEWSRTKAKPEPCWWETASARERHAQQLLADAGRLAASSTNVDDHIQ